MRSRIRLTSAALLAGAIAAVIGTAHTASAQSCPHAVVFTLPGVTWKAVLEARPPALLAAARDGSLGSVSVRTNAARTTYASGYATLGAGARVDAPPFAGAPSAEGSNLRGRLLQRGVVTAGRAEMERLADETGYGARPGALASALRAPVVAVGNSDSGDPSPLPTGLHRWALLSAMDTSGRVDLSATGAGMLRRTFGAPFGVSSDLAAHREAVDRALQIPCSVLIVDPGDLGRVDAALAAPPEAYDARFDRSWALRRADDLFGYIREALEPRRDLLIAVTPTSPLGARQVHLGAALAVGDGFPPGTALSSAATRRPGLVTLPDVAPTIVEYMGEQRPASMIGRPWFARHTDVPLRAGDAVALDDETLFVDRLKSPTATGFIVVQVVAYAALLPFIARRDGPNAGARAAHIAALAFVAFPASTYLIGLLPAHRLGVGGFVAVLLAIDAALVAGAAALSTSAVARLLALSGFTFALLVTDLLVSAPLQLNTVFGYSPTVAGRFAGIGNIAFAVLGISALLTGALLVHVGSGARAFLVVAALLYAAAVIVDGAPQLGGDVGGTIALVPALGATLLMLWGRRPGFGAVLLGILLGLAAVAAFLVVDLARPPEARTHLARLFEDFSQRGFGVVWDTIRRKAGSNIDVFRSSVYTLFVPPALGVMALLLRRPRGRWNRLSQALPSLRAALAGGLLLAVLGFAVNDSGIVIPAVVLSFLLPLTLLVHLLLDREPTR